MSRAWLRAAQCYCERCVLFLLFLCDVFVVAALCDVFVVVWLSRRLVSARPYMSPDQIQPLVSLIIPRAVAEAIGRLKASDVNVALAAGRRADVKAADSLMLDARVLAKKLDISAEDGFKHVTRLDVRLAMFLVKKRAPGDVSFRSVAEIAQALRDPQHFFHRRRRRARS